MGSSQSLPEEEHRPPVRITGGGNAINPQSGAPPMRHHKHLYLVLGQPKIRYTGHPGRGPLMFHTTHYIGDGHEDSVEELEGFSLLGTVAHRPQPPLVVPLFNPPSTGSEPPSHATTARVKFCVDIAPECRGDNALYIDAYIASTVKFDATASAMGNGGFVIRRPQNPNRPVSPFNVASGMAQDGPEGNGKIFSQEIRNEGGKRLTFFSCEIPIESFKVVNETKKMEGKNVPVEGCIIFRLSWKGKKIGKENDENSKPNESTSADETQTENLTTTTTTPTPHPDQQPRQQEGYSQMISFWEIPDVSKLNFERKAVLDGADPHHISPKTLNRNAEKIALKLKPFTSRYLFTSDAVEGHANSIFRVDDVYDLAGDDDIGPAPSRAGENPHGKEDVDNNSPSPAAGRGSGRRKRKGEEQEEDDDDDDDETEVQGGGAATAGPSIAVNNDDEDDGNECVVCLTNKKNALLLPCRHLCLCTECAPMLRQQTNKCPVCRASITKVVQI